MPSKQQIQLENTLDILDQIRSDRIRTMQIYYQRSLQDTAEWYHREVNDAWLLSKLPIIIPTKYGVMFG